MNVLKQTKNRIKITAIAVFWDMALFYSEDGGSKYLVLVVLHRFQRVCTGFLPYGLCNLQSKYGVRFFH
jgi:hypothetical protein